MTRKKQNPAEKQNQAEKPSMPASTPTPVPELTKLDIANAITSGGCYQIKDGQLTKQAEKATEAMQ